MTHAPSFLRRPLFALVFVVGTLSTTRAAAAMPEGDTLFDYGLRGLAVGLEIGLAVGYISTGPHFDSDTEWRKLVVGAGVGTLIGMSTGLVVALADTTHEGGVPLGYYLLRDSGYGAFFGAAMGALVGVLIWVDEGTPKDILKGASYGTLIGAVVGAGYGVIEAINTGPRRSEFGLRVGGGMRVTVAPTPARGLAALLVGHFG
jgi:hypothetical protein